MSKIEIDTNHYKGNYPDSASLEGCLAPDAALDALTAASWRTILPQTKLSRATSGTIFRKATAAWRRRVARAPQHLSGRRRQPFADPWNAGSAIDRRARPAERACATLLRGVLRIVTRVGSSVDACWRGVRLAAAMRCWMRAREEWWALCAGRLARSVLASSAIGDRASLAARFPATHHLSSREQAAVGDATEDVLTALADANQAYVDRFGFIFIVCATGKTANEMLELLRERLPNDRDTELRIAAEEQAKITALRLEAA